MKTNRQLDYSQKVMIAKDYQNRDLTIQQVADKYHISRQTVYKVVKNMEELA